MKNLHRSYIPEDWSLGVSHTDSPVFHFSSFLTEKECDIITHWAESKELVDGAIMSGADVKKSETRKSKICWLPTAGWDWLYDRIFDSVNSTNYWGFDVHGFSELIQFTKYDSKNGPSFYKYHRDTGPGFQHRKISFVILLDDPKDFEGGEFNLELKGKVDLPKKGSAIMFPSFLLHQVDPVTSGCRNSLVAWIAGPKLK